MRMRVCISLMAFLIAGSCFAAVPSAAELRAQGDKSYEDGDYQTALDFFVRCRAIDPSFAGTDYRIARTALILKRRDVGLDATIRLMQAQPSLRSDTTALKLRADIESLSATGDLASNAEITTTVKTVQLILEDAVARTKANDNAGANKLADEARRRLLRVAPAAESNVDFWRLCGIAALILEDNALEAYSSECIARLNPRYTDDPQLSMLMARLNREPIEDRVKLIRQTAALLRACQISRILCLAHENPTGYAMESRAAVLRELDLFQRESDRLGLENGRRSDEAVRNFPDSLRSKGVEAALLDLVTAVRLAPHPNDLIARDDVRSLIANAEDKAKDAEVAGDYFTAQNLLASLNNVFQDSSAYRQRWLASAARVRVLYLYAPNEYRRLYRAWATKIGHPEYQPAEPDETWEVQLESIEPQMFCDLLTEAVNNHVEKVEYKQLLEAAIDNLLLLISTRGIEAEFNQVLVHRGDMRDSLLRVRTTLEETKGDIAASDLQGKVDGILKINKETVDLPERVAVFEMTNGAMGTLHNLCSVSWPHNVEEATNLTSGKFVGIGVQIERTDKGLVVVTPLENSSAQRAGIRGGDVISKIDGIDTSDWSLARAVRAIRGAEGSEVIVAIRRTGNADLFQFRLKRQLLTVETVKGWERRTTGGWDYYLDRQFRIAYVRVTAMNPQTASSLDAAMKDIQRDGGAAAVILDLRDNSGGLLDSCVDVASRFVAKGSIGASVNRDGVAARQFQANGENVYQVVPTEVLVNQFTASGAELIAGAMQDSDRAILIGARTAGAASVRDIESLSGGKAKFWLTTQYLRLPGGKVEGRIIERRVGSVSWGVEPNLSVPMSSEQMTAAREARRKIEILQTGDQAAGPVGNPREIIEKNIDPQLKAALLVLRARLALSDAVANH